MVATVDFEFSGVPEEPRTRRIGSLFRRKKSLDLIGCSSSSSSSFSDTSSHFSEISTRLPSILKHSSLSGLGISDNTTKSNMHVKQVSFGELTISFHEIILGDNPAVTKGLPITISWAPFEQITLTVAEYENQRSIQSPRRRKTNELFLPSTLRDAYIRSQNYTRAEISDVNRIVVQIQKSRLETAALASQNNKGILNWKTLFIRKPSRN